MGNLTADAVLQELRVRLARLEGIVGSLAELMIQLEHDVEAPVFGERIQRLERDVQLLLENQHKLINLMARRAQGFVGERPLLAMGGGDVLFAGLTPTEVRVLKILSGGASSGPEVCRLLGKSREHMARLLNKLFREGYVERHVDRIPYTYSLIESIKPVISERLGT